MERGDAKPLLPLSIAMERGAAAAAG